MKIHLRYFASLREALGPSGTLELPEGSTVADARARLAGLGGDHARVLAPGRAVRAARNQTMCGEAEALADGDELAFFPPVTGG